MKSSSINLEFLTIFELLKLLSHSVFEFLRTIPRPEKISYLPDLNKKNKLEICDSYLNSTSFFIRTNLHMQTVVFRFQGTDLLDIDCKAIVQVHHLIFLIPPRHHWRAEWGIGRPGVIPVLQRNYENIYTMFIYFIFHYWNIVSLLSRLSFWGSHSVVFLIRGKYD